MKKHLKNFFLGFLIGSTMSVPGVSGGTTAIALGCYEKILTATAELRGKENIYYLTSILFGGISGFFLFAGLFHQAFRILPITMTMIFCAAAGTGVFLLGRDIPKKDFSINGALFFFLGFGAVIWVERLPEGIGDGSPLLMVFWGILLSAGIILPGISTSHLLLVFGLYDDLTEISAFRDLISLLPLALGVGLGILLLTKPLAKALKQYPAYCRFALLGFAVGSLKALIVPCIGNPQASYLPWFQIFNGMILASGTAVGILKLNQRENKLKKL
ncbi:MAG: DUF368 domain-containing protein [Clostridia bacterium]|nr:DUF368 domain-containing protein [Clostridia bacterium]